MIVLNGAEIHFDHPIEKDRWRRHQELNTVLEEVGTKPNVMYLTKIRNKDKAQA